MPSIDYEALTKDIPDPAEPEEILSEALASERDRAAAACLPLDHPKYQGIASAKGYEQTPNRLKRVHYSHEAMIDVILAEPTITQNQLAERFGHSVSWISIVMGSDAFQAALAKRRDDVTNPVLVATIEERFRGLATQSLQVLAEKLETTRNPDLALKALEISSKALGFGARTPAGGTVVNNSFVVALPPKMESAEDWAAAHAKRIN